MQSGATKERTVMVGDTTYDIEMAKNAGIKCIGVSYGYHNVKNLKMAGVDAIVDSFRELPNVIELLIGL